MASARRKARVLALQALYEIDSTGHDRDSVLDRLLEESPVTPDVRDFAQTRLAGILEHRQEIERRM